MARVNRTGSKVEDVDTTDRKEKGGRATGEEEEEEEGGRDLTSGRR